MLFQKSPHRRHTGFEFYTLRIKSKSINRPQKPVWLIKTFLVTLSILIFWLMGLVWFVNQVPKQISYDKSQTDAVVVLTGGKNRLDTGLKLFFKGYGTEHISANLNYKRISSFEVLNSFISDLVLSSPQ